MDLPQAKAQAPCFVATWPEVTLMYLQISRFRSLIYITNSLAMNSLWTVAFSCWQLQTFAERCWSAAPVSPSWSLVWLCAHPSLHGSFKVLVIRTVDFYKVVTFTLLCLYCHYVLKVLRFSYVSSWTTTRLYCKNRAHCMQWGRCEWLMDDGTATAPCLQDIPLCSVPALRPLHLTGAGSCARVAQLERLWERELRAGSCWQFGRGWTG